LEGLLAKPELLRGDDPRVIDDVQNCLDFLRPAVASNLDLGQRLKTGAAVDLAVAVQVGDVFAIGVDADLAQL
jgi:hypothetical protein